VCAAENDASALLSEKTAKLSVASQQELKDAEDSADQADNRERVEKILSELNAKDPRLVSLPSINLLPLSVCVCVVWYFSIYTVVQCRPRNHR